MATRLYSNQNDKNKPRNSMKLKINCRERIATNPETRDWLELTSKFDHTSSDFKIYTGLLEKRTNIVAKIGPRKLDEEFEIGKKLEGLLPTFIEFTCIFKCLDNFTKMNSTTKEVCKKDGTPITVLLMPYYTIGRIDSWKWDRSNFELMKNVMKHVFLSLIYAKAALGFIHLDLHLGNILLKKSTKAKISYGDFGILDVQGLIPIIMDFEKSHFVENHDNFVCEDLINFISLMSNSCNVKFDCNKIVKRLELLITNKKAIDVTEANHLCSLIDNLEIRSVYSERSPLPDFLKPMKL